MTPNVVKSVTPQPKAAAPVLEKPVEEPFAYDGSVAVVVHIYGYDVWEKSIQPRLAEVLDGKCKYDLYISLTARDNIDETRARILAIYPNAVIIQVENVGEDVNGFMHCVKAIEDSGKEYDYILKLHTKTKDLWRTDLLNGTIPHNCVTINKLLTGHAAMIGPRKWIKAIPDAAVHVQPILTKIGCGKHPLRFMAGTMFWIRFDIIKKYLFGGKLPVDYFNEPYKKMGLKQHAMERIFGMMVTDVGGTISGV